MNNLDQSHDSRAPADLDTPAAPLEAGGEPLDVAAGALDPAAAECVATPDVTGRLARREEELSRRLAELEQVVQRREEECRSLLRDRELSAALAGRQLVPGGAAQLLKLLRDEFEAVEMDGQLRVYSRDGLAVAPAVARLLARPDFAHFCLPSTRGGVATPSPTPTPSEGESKPPATLGELIVQRWRDAAANSPPQRPLGLRRRMF